MPRPRFHVNLVHMHLNYIRTRFSNLDSVCPSSSAAHVLLFG